MPQLPERRVKGSGELQCRAGTFLVSATATPLEGHWEAHCSVYVEVDGPDEAALSESFENAIGGQWWLAFDDGDRWSGILGPVLRTETSEIEARHIEVDLGVIEWTKLEPSPVNVPSDPLPPMSR